ncbi:MAG: SDR family oxidoreductase [Deltaproteobacteria bacterium]|nr:SDR family oxidoreductase [Deltaproteobacteria bacterium]
MKDPRHIAVTGASGGLGRALSLEYARPGIVLSLCGRDIKALAETARLARLKGAECFEALFDAREGSALAGWLATADRRAPLDLVIANAGICRGLGPDGLEAPWDAVDTLRVNGESAVLTALYAARIMRARGRGQIAVISSQAGRVPLTYTPGYAASKAASRSYALSLRDGMKPHGVEVTCVCPGYLASPMQEHFRGGLFGAWPAARAAARIARRLPGNPREISFPFLMSFLTWAFAFLPAPFKGPVLRAFSFRYEAERGPVVSDGAAGTMDPQSRPVAAGEGPEPGSGAGPEPGSGAGSESDGAVDPDPDGGLVPESGGGAGPEPSGK